MSLSLCLVTKNSAAFVHGLLAEARAYADEIVVAVDAASTDATEEICARYADKLFRVDVPGPSLEGVLAWLNRQCSGDWILRLDDDELPSAGLVQALPALLEDREMTHYWLRRRWLTDTQPLTWIAQHPWWPDWQLRLFRNLPSLVRVPGELHTSYVVPGSGRHVPNGAIYHLDLIYHSYEERLAKARRYELSRPERPLDEYYLVAAGHGLPTRAAPADDPPWIGAGRHTATRISRAGVQHVSATEVEQASLQTCDYGPDLFRASLVVDEWPERMRPGQCVAVDVWVCNESRVPWCGPIHGLPEVRLSYHWLRLDGQIEEYNGNRARLPHTVQPGARTIVPASVQAPAQPGTFILRWDLVIEDVAWFSAYGLKAPEAPVHIEVEACGQTERRTGM
jgi:hypothetical protein